MLVLKRKEGQWTEITHRSGDVIRVRTYHIQATSPGHLPSVALVFDDEPRHFQINRPERKVHAQGDPQRPDALQPGPDGDPQAPE